MGGSRSWGREATTNKYVKWPIPSSILQYFEKKKLGFWLENNSRTVCDGYQWRLNHLRSLGFQDVGIWEWKNVEMGELLQKKCTFRKSSCDLTGLRQWPEGFPLMANPSSPSTHWFIVTMGRGDLTFTAGQVRPHRFGEVGICKGNRAEVWGFRKVCNTGKFLLGRKYCI